MKPNRIFLIRHGESEGNVDETVFAHTLDHKVSLTNKGFIQARKCGKKLHNLVSQHSTAFHVSPFLRADQTYREISKAWKHALDVSFDPLIREREWSGWLYDSCGKRIGDDKWHSFYFRFSNGGESPADVYQRISTFFIELFRDNEDGDVVIVGHGTMLNIMITKLLKLHPEVFEKMRNFRNCEIVELRNEGSKYDLYGHFIQDRFHTRYHKRK